MLIERPFIVTSLYKKLMVSFLAISLALLVGCSSGPRETMAYDSRSGVYYQQVEKVCDEIIVTNRLVTKPPQVGTLYKGLLVSRVEESVLWKLEIWVVPPPGYRWMNPSSISDMRIVPSNLSK